MSSSAEKPVLSISLLCSGRSKTTDKCLASLKKIKDQISTEIVVVDTGCDEQTRKSVDKYSDKVVEFTWCDDFSAARNAGLKECHGEWFLYIDDDEWFDDVEPIVDFFKTGEYKQYYCACYKQRNYKDFSGNNYVDDWVSRMMRLTPETAFYGKIHEFLVPIGDTEKLIDVYANHYGYVYTSQEARWAHSRRNVPAIIEMMKEDPESLRWPMQLSQEYYSIEDYSSLQELSEKMLRRLERKNTRYVESYVNIQRGNYYLALVWIQAAKCQWDEVIHLCQEYQRDKRNNDLCIAMLYYYEAVAYYNKSNQAEALKFSKKYISIYDAWKHRPDYETAIKDNFTIMSEDVFRDRVLKTILDIAVYAGMVMGSAAMLFKYYKDLVFDKSNPRVPIISKEVVDYISEHTYDRRFEDVCRTFMASSFAAGVVITEVQSIEYGNSEGFDRLLQVFSEIDSDHPYITYMHIRYADEQHNDVDYESMYRSLIDKTDDIFDLNTCIWDIAEKHGVDLGQYLLDVPFDRWKRGVDVFFDGRAGSIDETEDDRTKKVSIISEKLEGLRTNGDIRFQYYFLKRLERTLRIDSSEGYEKLQKDLFSYITSNVSLFERVYKPEIISNSMAFVDPSCRMSMEMLKVLSTINQRKPSENVKEFTKCIGIYEPLD